MLLTMAQRGDMLKHQEALHIQGKESIWEDVGLQCELCSISVSTRLDGVNLQCRNIPSSKSGFREKPLCAGISNEVQWTDLCCPSFLLVVFVVAELSWN